MARKGRGRIRRDSSRKRVPRCVGHRKCVPPEKVGVSDFLCLNLCLMITYMARKGTEGKGRLPPRERVCTVVCGGKVGASDFCCLNLCLKLF